MCHSENIVAAAVTSDAAARTLWGRVYRRYLKLGSNLRFYIRPR